MSPESALTTPVLLSRAKPGVDLLALAARVWYAVTVTGQAAFLLYILGFYGKTIVMGEYVRWNQVLAGGYRPGDSVGNISVGMHTLLAAVIMLCGALQLLPALRRWQPAVHRWSGRLYVVLAVISSLIGMAMTWLRPVAGGPVMNLGLSIDALLILVFAVLAVRHARSGRIGAHRRWALRLFMVVSAVWFFRVGLMFWMFVNGGPAGFDPVTFRGPFLDVLAFAQYLLPLLLLELYLRAQDSGAQVLRVAAAMLLTAASAALALGIAMCIVAMWWPKLG